MVDWHFENQDKNHEDGREKMELHFQALVPLHSSSNSFRRYCFDIPSESRRTDVKNTVAIYINGVNYRGTMGEFRFKVFIIILPCFLISKASTARPCGALEEPPTLVRFTAVQRAPPSLYPFIFRYAFIVFLWI